MKKLRFISGLTIITMFFLIGCNGGSSTKNNEFLGELPSIDKNYNTKLEKKEKAIEESTDMEKSFKLEKEKDLLDKEYRTKIKEYVSSSSICGKQVPFDAIGGEMFSINQIVIDTVFSNGRVQFEFSMTIKNDIKPQRFTPFVYFKATDSQGNEINGTTSVAAGSRKSIEPNSNITANGILEAYRLEDFAKIIEITKEEYNKGK